MTFKSLSESDQSESHESITKSVLKIALSPLNDLRGDNLTDASNCAYRYADYKQCTRLVHNSLEKKDGKHIRFMESKEDEKMLIEAN